ncbi:MAG: hypothetical protein U0586_15270 [Candidatus Brocadiaceae bacterium]
MAVRYRKYYNQCKAVKCSGRRSKSCPETPRKVNGEYKTCGVWCIEFFDDNKQWQSLTFKDVRNKTDAEKRFALFISKVYWIFNDCCRVVLRYAPRVNVSVSQICNLNPIWNVYHNYSML